MVEFFKGQKRMTRPKRSCRNARSSNVPVKPAPDMTKLRAPVEKGWRRTEWITWSDKEDSHLKELSEEREFYDDAHDQYGNGLNHLNLR